MSEQLERRSLTVFSATKDRRVAHTGGQGNSSEECEEYARRLVACWNACQGIETEILEALGDGGITEAHKNATDLADAAKASMECSARATEAERLLRAVVVANGDLAEQCCPETRDDAEDADTLPAIQKMGAAINAARAFLAGTKPAPDPLLVEARKAFEQIASLGGNLPDERLETASGPNDARDRGIKYTTARQIARAYLAKATP